MPAPRVGGWTSTPWTALLLTVLVGCQSPPGEAAGGDGAAPPRAADPAASAPLTFHWEAGDPGDFLERPDVRATAGSGQVEVTARLSAPDPCRDLSGELSRSGQELTLTVSVRGRDDGMMCTAVVATFGYTATLGGLAPGSYTLRVVHDYPGTGWPSGPVLEESLTVR